MRISRNLGIASLAQSIELHTIESAVNLSGGMAFLLCIPAAGGAATYESPEVTFRALMISCGNSDSTILIPRSSVLPRFIHAVMDKERIEIIFCCPAVKAAGKKCLPEADPTNCF